MSEARKKTDEEIQRVLKLGLTELPALRAATKDWGLADFDNAEKFQTVLAHLPDAKTTVFANLRELRAELMRRDEARAAALRNRDMVTLLSAKIDELKRPYWTGTLTFWVAFAAMVIAWLAWLYPGGPGRMLSAFASWLASKGVIS